MTVFKHIKALIAFALLAVSMNPVISVAADAGDHKDHHGLDISDVWARETMGRTMSAAAYMTLKNGTHADEKLLSVEGDFAKRIELHLSSVKGGQMTMMPVQDGLDIPKNKSVKLKPMSYHVMMMGLSKPLAKGDVFPLTLVFEKAGKVTVYVTVRGMDGAQ